MAPTVCLPKRSATSSFEELCRELDESPYASGIETFVSVETKWEGVLD